MRSIGKYLAFLSLAALAPRAGTVTLDPSAVEAGWSTVVTVQGLSNACAPIASHLMVGVSDSILSLGMVLESNPAAGICAPGLQPYAVDFSLPPLAPRAYTVLVSRYQACVFSPTPCPAALPLPDTGSLQALDGAALRYRIDPKQTGANRPFRLQLTSPDFQCGSKFDSLSAEVKGHRITLSFLHEPHPEALCPAVVAAYGPAFDLAGLPTGTYQVFAAAKSVCPSPCPLALIGPQLAGALAVEPNPRKPIWIDPQTVRAGFLESLALHAGGLACNDILLNKRAELKGGSLILRYAMTRTRVACPLDTVFVLSETFALPVLTAGAYPVLLAPDSCAADNPICGKTAPTAAVDTLYAASAAGIRARGREGKRGREGAGPWLFWRGKPVDAAGRHPPTIAK